MGCDMAKMAAEILHEIEHLFFSQLPGLSQKTISKYIILLWQY
jgi:hypothetical protein